MSNCCFFHMMVIELFVQNNMGGERMQTCLITFLSQTAAFQFQKLAQHNDIPVKIMQTPKELQHGGCSYAARCARSDVRHLVGLCRDYGVGYSRIFVEFLDANGRKKYEELG